MRRHVYPFFISPQMPKRRPVDQIKALFLFTFILVFFLSLAEARTMERLLPSRTYNLLPQVLHEKIVLILKAPPLSMSVVSAYDGKIETDYTECEGEFHGILFWKKRWKERIKYYITIVRDWTFPERSCLSIYSVTEQRPNENYSWAFKESGLTKNKVSHILEVIDSRIKG